MGDDLAGMAGWGSRIYRALTPFSFAAVWSLAALLKPQLKSIGGELGIEIG
jgi:hypothetical protein